MERKSHKNKHKRDKKQKKKVTSAEFFGVVYSVKPAKKKLIIRAKGIFAR